MNKRNSGRQIGWLALGFLAGLVIILATSALFGVLPDWLSLSEAPTLASDSLVGALGPIVLDWEQWPAPAPGSFAIDGSISVTINFEAGLLMVAPDEPLSAGEHNLQLQTDDGDTREWLFQVRQPEPSYLKRGAGTSSLYRWNGGEPVLLSGEHSVLEYAPNWQGEWLAYAVTNNQGGTDLWRVDRVGQTRQELLSCGRDRCNQLAWKPDGTRLAFSRWPASEPERPILWTLALEDLTAGALFLDESILGNDPAWSPDGRWLAFYDLGADGTRLLDADTLRQEVVPNRAGASGAWSGDSQTLFLPFLVFKGEEPVTHLYRLDPAERDLQAVLAEQGSWRQVGEPSLGLAGRWMALSAQRGSSSAAPELWLVRLADNDARRLAGVEGWAYGGPSWDAAGQRLLFQRFAFGGSTAAPDVMIWVEGSVAPELLVAGAGSAKWIH